MPSFGHGHKTETPVNNANASQASIVSTTSNSGNTNANSNNANASQASIISHSSVVSNVSTDTGGADAPADEDNTPKMTVKERFAARMAMFSKPSSTPSAPAPEKAAKSASKPLNLGNSWMGNGSFTLRSTGSSSHITAAAPPATKAAATAAPAAAASTSWGSRAGSQRWFSSTTGSAATAVDKGHENKALEKKASTTDVKAEVKADVNVAVAGTQKEAENKVELVETVKEGQVAVEKASEVEIPTAQHEIAAVQVEVKATSEVKPSPEAAAAAGAGAAAETQPIIAPTPTPTPANTEPEGAVSSSVDDVQDVSQPQSNSHPEPSATTETTTASTSATSTVDEVVTKVVTEVVAPEVPTMTEAEADKPTTTSVPENPEDHTEKQEQPKLEEPEQTGVEDAAAPAPLPTN
jgi:hypothetical protein